MMCLITCNFVRHRFIWLLPAFAIACCTGCSGAGESPDAPEDASTGQRPAESSANLRPDLAHSFRMIQEGQPDRARWLLQRFILENPNDAQALFLFGLTFHVQHRFEQARIHFRSALDLDRGYPPLLYFYGWCLYNLQELDEAKASFEAHLQLQPEEADTYFALGLIALDQNRLDDARARFEHAISLYDDQPRHTVARGRTHGKLGETYARMGGDANLQQARQHLTTATELNQDDHESLYQLYRVLLSLDETDAAQLARLRHEEARQRAGLPGVPAP